VNEGPPCHLQPVSPCVPYPSTKCGVGRQGLGAAMGCMAGPGRVPRECPGNHGPEISRPGFCKLGGTMVLKIPDMVGTPPGPFLTHVPCDICLAKPSRSRRTGHQPQGSTALPNCLGAESRHSAHQRRRQHCSGRSHCCRSRASIAGRRSREGSRMTAASCCPEAAVVSPMPLHGGQWGLWGGCQGSRPSSRHQGGQ